MDAAALFSQIGFPDVDQARWRALAEKTLAGATYEDALVSTTDDGIRINPHLPGATDAKAWPRSVPDKPWIVTQRIDDPDPKRANRQAIEDVEGGATGLALVFEGAPNAFGFGLHADPKSLAAALDGVPLNGLHLRIDVHPASRASVDWLIAILAARRVDPAQIGLAFGIDPGAIFAGTGRLRMSIEALRASMPQSLVHFFAMDVPGVLLEADGRVFHNAGATEAQELGVMLATAVSHLRMFEEARQPLVYGAPHIGFALSVDQDQFVSIAKVRALRRLWARVQEACGVEPAQAAIHAETSYRMLAAQDAETNILRSTIAAFAAGIGGADTVSILPHSVPLGLPEAFARRVARNTHAVLVGESHVDHVADAVLGSGSVEALTDALCETAWAEFQTIEAGGGVLDGLLSGSIQNRIAEARSSRASSYRSGVRAIIGTTRFPAATERPIPVLPSVRWPAAEDGTVFCRPLPPVRVDETIGMPA